MVHEPESYAYNVQGKTFIVTPVYPQEGGRRMSDILLKLMCEDEKKKQEKP